MHVPPFIFVHIIIHFNTPEWVFNGKMTNYRGFDIINGRYTLYEINDRVSMAQDILN